MAASEKSLIQFHFLVDPFSFKDRNKLKQFLVDQAALCKKGIYAINYIFCSDEYLLDLNKSHLSHNTLTDIITFELSGPGEPLISDIYISVERVKENAPLFNQSFQKELHRVIFHGMLHLCGFKDKKPTDQKLMKQMEEKWLLKYFK
jgi:probable rRNA maturation factor